MEFGDVIRNARIKKGLKQEELASLIGVAKTTISGYENGSREPDVPKIKKLMEALDLKASEIFGGTEPPRHETTPSEAALLDAFRRLDAEGQDKVVSYAEDLVASGRYEKKELQGYIA